MRRVQVLTKRDLLGSATIAAITVAVVSAVFVPGVCLAATPKGEVTKYPSVNYTDTSPHKSDFAQVNGIKLNYLDWGGDGPALMMIHGIGDDPHVFDDLASLLREKLEFLTEDLASHSDAPSDAELKVYLSRHAEVYREEPRLSFEHIYFNRERRAKSAHADAAAALAQLNGKQSAAVDLDSLGDPTLLPTDFRLASKAEIARLFGEGFAKQLEDAATGVWAGPFESSYGLHVVRISERSPGALPELSKVRETVLRDLLAERRKQGLETAYAKLRQRYTVTIEDPKESPNGASQSQRIARR